MNKILIHQQFTAVAKCQLTSTTNLGATRFSPRKKTFSSIIIYNIHRDNYILREGRIRAHTRMCRRVTHGRARELFLFHQEKILIYDFVGPTKMINFTAIKSLTHE